jgi:hypothetical protein
MPASGSARPVSPIVRLRLATRIRASEGCSPAEAILKATLMIQFVESAGVDLVMPGWVPIDQDGPVRPRSLSWDDLPKPSEEVLEREPWRMYEPPHRGD